MFHTSKFLYAATANDELFADLVAQAVDAFIGRVVAETIAAIRADGSRDFLDNRDISAIYHHVAMARAKHKWPPLYQSAIVEACNRADIKVAPR